MRPICPRATFLYSLTPMTTIPRRHLALCFRHCLKAKVIYAFVTRYYRFRMVVSYDDRLLLLTLIRKNCLTKSWGMAGFPTWRLCGVGLSLTKSAAGEQMY